MILMVDNSGDKCTESVNKSIKGGTINQKGMQRRLAYLPLDKASFIWRTNGQIDV